jgi:hypothetical protein
MTREQIIEILETWDDYVLGGDINDDIADAILALPLDVPNWATVESKADDIADCMSNKGFERGEWLGFKEGAGWAISEIIKRNK